MTLDEALAGKEIPSEIRNNLTLVTVPYFSFDREVREGQLVVHKEVTEDVQQIFGKLSEMRFPIQKMTPIVTYGWNDDKSMADNNTSAFNYRFISGTDRLSNHSYGRAIDINPMQNPCVQESGLTAPPNTRYDVNVPGTMTESIVSLFTSNGWKWGGNWTQPKDWQHFEKP